MASAGPVDGSRGKCILQRPADVESAASCTSKDSQQSVGPWGLPITTDKSGGVGPSGAFGCICRLTRAHARSDGPAAAIPTLAVVTLMTSASALTAQRNP